MLPRCRLSLSWSCTSDQGYGCPPFKRDRELGSERREAVRLLTGGGVWYLSGKVIKYDRNGGLGPLVYQLSDRAVLGSYAPRDKG